MHLTADDARIPGSDHRLHHPLIIGHYGGCNTGDEAMLTALLRAVGPELRQGATIVMKNGHGENLRSSYGADTVPAGLLPVLRALLKSDGLVLGGGTHFHDDYTIRRYLRHFRYMLRIASLSMLAKLLGQRVYWLGMGFGPFYRWPTRWVTKLGLKYCSGVTVRDTESQKEISRWIAPGKLSLAFDLAALLADDPLQRNIPNKTGQRLCPTLGISVTSVRQSITSGPRVDSIIWRRLASVVNRALDNKPNMRIKIVVLRGGNREDDWTLSAEMHAALEAIHPGRSELVPYTPDLQNTLRSIASCDAFIATRYHAGVLAYLAGCNLLFLAYHRKVYDLAREIRLSDAACVTPSETLSESDLMEKINHLTEGSDLFRARLPVSEAARRAWINIQTLGEIHQRSYAASR